MSFIRLATAAAVGAEPGETVDRFLTRDEKLHPACSNLDPAASALGPWHLNWSARFIPPSKWIVWVRCDPDVLLTQVAEDRIPQVLTLDPAGADEQVSQIVASALAAWSVDDVSHAVIALNDNAAALRAQ